MLASARRENVKKSDEQLDGIPSATLPETTTENLRRPAR